MRKGKSKLLLAIGAGMVLAVMTASGALAQIGPPMSRYVGGIDGRISTYNGVAAPVGSIVEIYDPDMVFCGRDTINTNLGPGRYGSISVEGDDSKTAEVDEGPTIGQTLSFYLNGRLATTTGPDEPIFDGIWYPFKEVNLEAEGVVSADFTAPAGQDAEPEDIVNYSVMVENTGNGIDFYTITAYSSHGWIVEYSEDFQYAWSGETIYIDFQLEIPPGNIETTDQVEFTVTSELDASVTFTANVITVVSMPTDINDDLNGTLPGEFRLYQNYPNPFNPMTDISFDLPVSSQVNLTVFDLLGRKVCDYDLSRMSAGHHSFTFDAGSLASGVYFYKLQTENSSAIKRMVLLK